MARLAFKDDGDGYYEVEVLDGEDPPEWTQALTPTPLHAASNSKKLSDELALLSVQYKADVQALQLSWLSVTISNGTQEATKKAEITAELAARKTQYVADIAAAKARYL